MHHFGVSKVVFVHFTICPKVLTLKLLYKMSQNVLDLQQFILYH